MQIVRRIFPLAIVVLLGACAGTTPSTPEPPVGESPVSEPTPTDEVPYGGQWQVVFTADDQSFAHLLNITTAYNDGQQDGAFGPQQLCTGQGADPCAERSDSDVGVGLIATVTGEDGTTRLSLVIYDTIGRKVYTTENLRTETDAQGRQVLKGAAVWLEGGSFSNSVAGTVTATKVEELSDAEPGGVLTGSWDGTTTALTLGTAGTGFFLTQAGDQVSGEAFIFPDSDEGVSGSIGGLVTGNRIFLITKVTLDSEYLFFTYLGTLNETTLSGQVTVQPVDGSGTPEQGTFTVTKSAN